MLPQGSSCRSCVTCGLKAEACTGHGGQPGHAARHDHGRPHRGRRIRAHPQRWSSRAPAAVALSRPLQHAHLHQVFFASVGCSNQSKLAAWWLNEPASCSLADVPLEMVSCEHSAFEERVMCRLQVAWCRRCTCTPRCTPPRAAGCPRAGLRWSGSTAWRRCPATRCAQFWPLTEPAHYLGRRHEACYGAGRAHSGLHRRLSLAQCTYVTRALGLQTPKNLQIAMCHNTDIDILRGQ